MRMTTTFPFPGLIVVALLSLLIASCGGDGDGGETTTSSNTDDTSAQSQAAAAGATDETGKTSTSSFVATPALTTCLTDAKFTQSSTTPSGAVISFDGPSDARVMVAQDDSAAFELASGVGSDAQPANIDGTYVTLGDAAAVAPALECLRAADAAR